MLEIIDRQKVEGLDDRWVFLGKNRKTAEWRAWVEDSTGWIKNKGSVYAGEHSARIGFNELIAYMKRWG